MRLLDGAASKSRKALWTWASCQTEEQRDSILAQYPKAIVQELPEGKNPITGTPARFFIVNPTVASLI